MMLDGDCSIVGEARRRVEKEQEVGCVDFSERCSDDAWESPTQAGE